MTLVIASMLMGATPVAFSDTAQPHVLPPAYSRIALLGDSITDGLTYSLLLQQALSEAGYQAPISINAGIGGDTASGMSDRLERDVLSRHPTMVFLSAGINDSNDVAPEDFRKSLISMIERLKAQNIGITLLLPSAVRPFDFSKVDRTKLTDKELEELDKDEAETPVELGRQAGYRVIMRQLATRYALPLADINGEMQKSYAQGTDLWERDGTHLNFAGYRAFVRAVLDAMDLRTMPVPAVAKIVPAPGIFENWKLHALPDGTPRLDEKTIAALQLDEGWQKLKLPITTPQDGWYWEQARQYGVALALDKQFGSNNFQALTTFRLKAAQSLYLNTGASVSSIWLRKNGEPWHQVWKHPGGALGWHPSSRARLDVTPGEYSLLAETGSQFFVSLTPDDAL